MDAPHPLISRFIRTRAVRPGTITSTSHPRTFQLNLTSFPRKKGAFFPLKQQARPLCPQCVGLTPLQQCSSCDPHAWTRAPWWRHLHSPGGLLPSGSLPSPSPWFCRTHFTEAALAKVARDPLGANCRAHSALFVYPTLLKQSGLLLQDLPEHATSGTCDAALCLPSSCFSDTVAVIQVPPRDHSQGKTKIFFILPRSHLPFSASFSSKCTEEFPRG